MKYDLNLLWVLDALGRTRRVADAARLLGMTQPGVSNALKRLRDRYADPLFVRTGAGMQPTPRGLQLIEATHDILKQHEQRMLNASEFDPSRVQSEFRLALSDIGELVFLPRILHYLSTHAPHSTVRALSLSPSALASGLEDGTVDLAVGYFPDVGGSSFFQQRLFSHGFVCLARADHPRIGKALTRAAFLSLGHAVIQAEGRSQEVFEQFLRKQHIERRVVLQVPHFMSIPMVITQSDLITTVPYAVGASFAQLTPLQLLRPPFTVPRFDLKQHWHRRFHKDARNRWLRTLVATLFDERQDEWKGQSEAIDGV